MSDTNETKRIAVELTKTIIMATPNIVKSKEDVFALYDECLKHVDKESPGLFKDCNFD